MYDPNESAFPTQEVGESGRPISNLCGGLTKRELLAAVALQGVLANPAYFVECQKRPGDWKEYAANAAACAADALLAELDK